ncbi:6-bladed beta-propeller [Parabacteroides distasonis]|uniref:6-bladed beta-propeller n=1 Tax=Parabacteroides distasonis TaxID=823 RepID=UPI003F744FA9
MNKYHLSLTIIFIIIFTGCKNKTSESNNYIFIDVMKEYPQKELALQDIFDIEYIQLETTDEFMTTGNVRAIGEKLIITKNNGRTDGNIFLFDRTTGKGIRKINRIGQGSEEYTNILEIVLDEERQEIFINNHYSGKIIVYDLEGNFKRSFKQRENYFYDEIGIFDKDRLICHDGYLSFDKEETKRNFFMLVSKQDGSIEELAIPYDQLKTELIIKQVDGKPRDWSVRNRQLIPHKDGWLLTDLSADTIYRSSPDMKLKPFIVRIPSVQSMDPEIFLFPNVLTDRYCFMQTVKKDFDFKTNTDLERTDLMYDKETNKIHEITLYNSDYLEKVSVKIMFEISTLSFFNNEGAVFSKSLPAHELVDAYKEGKLRGPLKKIASHLDEEDNPVIMIAKYKQRK